MTPNDAQLILSRIEAVDSKIDDHRAEVARRFDDVAERAGRIEVHAQQTNGRVGKLEIWRAKLEGARMAVAWLPATLVTVAASTTTGVLVYFLTG